MEPTYLISIDDIRKYKPIPPQINVDVKVLPAILEAQEFDLRPFLGDNFYMAIEAAAPDGFGDYEDLFNGIQYEHGGLQYKHEGLRAVLSYYAYSRLLLSMDSNLSGFDIVQKTNEFSQPASEKIRARLINQAISGAKTYQERVEDYLNRKATDYPLWRSSLNFSPKSSIKVSAVGGKNKVGGSCRCRRCGRYSCTGNCYNR